MELMDAFKTRRSYRVFKDTPVSDEQVQGLLEAFCLAPSPLNMQPWQFILITDPVVKAEVKAVGLAAKQAVADQDGPGWAAKYPMDFLEQVPLLIAVVCDPAKGGLGGFFNQPMGAFSAAAAGTQNLMLAAEEMGLGTVWFTFYDPSKMGAALGVPENLELVGVIPVGVPDEEPKAPPRKDPKVHQQRFTA